VEKNLKKAVRWLTAVKQVHTMAQNIKVIPMRRLLTGVCYGKEKGVEKNIEKAVELYTVMRMHKGVDLKSN